MSNTLENPKQKHKQTHKRTNNQTNKQTNEQTNKYTNKQHTHTRKQTICCFYPSSSMPYNLLQLILPMSPVMPQTCCWYFISAQTNQQTNTDDFSIVSLTRARKHNKKQQTTHNKQQKP